MDRQIQYEVSQAHTLVGKQMDKWMDTQTDRQTDRHTDRKTDRYTHRPTNKINGVNECGQN